MKGGQPSLSEMTRAALTSLIKNPNGFFLMVEGGLIVVAHHLNNAMRALEETLELERAIKVALDMFDIKETLIFVTADHSHALTINGYPQRGNPILGYVYNKARNHVMIQPYGFSSPYTTLSYANGPGFEHHSTGENERLWKDILKDFETPIHEDVEFLQSALWKGPSGLMEAKTWGFLPYVQCLTCSLESRSRAILPMLLIMPPKHGRKTIQDLRRWQSNRQRRS